MVHPVGRIHCVMRWAISARARVQEQTKQSLDVCDFAPSDVCDFDPECGLIDVVAVVLHLEDNNMGLMVEFDNECLNGACVMDCETLVCSSHSASLHTCSSLLTVLVVVVCFLFVLINDSCSGWTTLQRLLRLRI